MIPRFEMGILYVHYHADRALVAKSDPITVREDLCGTFTIANWQTDGDTATAETQRMQSRSLDRVSDALAWTADVIDDGAAAGYSLQNKPQILLQHTKCASWP